MDFADKLDFMDDDCDIEGFPNPLNVYQENGYESRKDYLESLADEYDCPIEIVRDMADILGEEEDFDGLVSAMRDWESLKDKG